MSGQYFVAFQHGDVYFYCSLWLICSLWVLHGMTLKVYVGFSLASLLCVFEICGLISFKLVTVVIGFPLLNRSMVFFHIRQFPFAGSIILTSVTMDGAWVE